MPADDPAEHSPLPPSVRDFLAPPRFAVVATLNPDGSALQAVVWYLLEGDEVVFNSMVGRRWPANLVRDPRVSFIVANGYDYVELRGSVEVDSDPARAQADIAALARRYHADDPDEAERMIERVFRPQTRVSFRLRPERVFEHFD